MTAYSYSHATHDHLLTFKTFGHYNLLTFKTFWPWRTSQGPIVLSLTQPSTKPNQLSLYSTLQYTSSCLFMQYSTLQDPRIFLSLLLNLTRPNHHLNLLNTQFTSSQYYSIYRVVVFVWVVLYSHGWKRVIVYFSLVGLLYSMGRYTPEFTVVDDGVPK